jgi:hypothetical protein
MTFLRSANVQTIAPSVRSAFVDLCRETRASLLNAAMSSKIAGDSTESISLDYASDAVHALADTHTAEYRVGAGAKIAFTRRVADQDVQVHIKARYPSL